MSEVSEAIDRSPTDAATGAQQPEPSTRSGRWNRSHTMWLLIVASLSPGVVAASARGWWEQLPPGVRLSAYVLSGILIVAACSLLLWSDDEHGGQSS